MRWLLAAAMLVVLGGCGALRTGQEIGTSSNLKLEPTSLSAPAVAGHAEKSYSSLNLDAKPETHPAIRLKAIMRELKIDLVTTDTKPVAPRIENVSTESTEKRLPDWSSGFITKVIRSHLDSGSSHFSKQQRHDREKSATTFTTSEIKEFVTSSIKYSGLFDNPPGSTDETFISQGDSSKSAVQDSIVRQRLKYYLFQYITNNYVDHLGTAVPAPKIASTMGNDTIIPFLTVILDAFFDEIYSYPILLESDKKAASAAKAPDPNADPGAVSANCEAIITVFGSKQPTYIAFEQLAYVKAHNNACATGDALGGIQIKAAKDGKKSSEISIGEAGTMRFAGEVGNQSTQALTGFVIREVGGFHVSAVVVGGLFTLGSNDTLSKAIETVASQISQRNIEQDLYESFKTTCDATGNCGTENTKITKISTLFSALYEQWKNSSSKK